MLANERTANEGMGNFRFFHHDDLLDTEEHANEKIAKVLESEDKDKPVFIVDCYEKKASIFDKNVINLRNATDGKIKLKIQAPFKSSENEK